VIVKYENKKDVWYPTRFCVFPLVLVVCVGTHNAAKELREEADAVNKLVLQSQQQRADAFALRDQIQRQLEGVTNAE